MLERKMGYRGSKSDSLSVKEQRVDGSLFLKVKLMNLKCILKGFERNYQIRILSNQINLRGRRLFTSKAQLVNPCFAKQNFDIPLNPWAFSGFIYGEGSFIICILKNNNKVGWQVKLEFWLSLHERDKVLLEQIQNYFGVGNITKHYSNKILSYRISSTKDLAKIIDHLDQYPLITQKLADYELFKEGYNLVINKNNLELSNLLWLFYLY